MATCLTEKTDDEKVDDIKARLDCPPANYSSADILKDLAFLQYMTLQAVLAQSVEEEP